MKKVTLIPAMKWHCPDCGCECVAGENRVVAGVVACVYPQEVRCGVCKSRYETESPNEELALMDLDMLAALVKVHDGAEKMLAVLDRAGNASVGEVVEAYSELHVDIRAIREMRGSWG